MKKKTTDNPVRCPLCKKHCPLNKPHCKKGEKYAQKLKEDTVLKKESNPKKHVKTADKKGS